MRLKVLVAEDEHFKRTAIEKYLESQEFDVRTVGNAYAGERLLEEEGFDIVITDMKMPGKDGLEFLKEINSRWPETSVIIMTAYGTVENAVEAMKSGAADYLTKPFRLEELLIRLKRIEKQRALEKELHSMREMFQSQFSLHQMVGVSSQMKKLIENIKVIARDDCTVLIEGATGTGKEMVANSIHYNSL